MFYVGDFETTTGNTVINEKQTRLWSAAVCTVSDSPDVTFRGTTIEEFIEYCSTLEDGDTIFFHNLKFDASFVLDYCLKNAWDSKPASKKAQFKGNAKTEAKPKLEHLISEMGTYYLLKLRWGFEELDEYKEINIWNSLLKIPMPVRKMPETYNLDTFKGDIDYMSDRPVGYAPTTEEWDYIERDCIVVAKALQIHLLQGQDKMTLGSDTLQEFKSMYGEAKYDRDFPKLRADLYLNISKDAYGGGFTWVRPDRKNIEYPKISCNDVNSMHPSSMYYELMPYTDDIQVNIGDPREDEDVLLWIANIDVYHIRCKSNRPPCIQLDKSTEYLDGDIELEHMNLTVTNVDWEIIEECYNIESSKINYYMGFYKATTGLFCEFIDTKMEIKGNKALPKGQRQIAKSNIVNLYGKFGEDFEKLIKNASYSYSKMKVEYKPEQSQYEQGTGEIPKDDKGKVLTTPYTPIAIFTCAYSRKKLINAIIANWDRFIYCDTDSIYLIGHEDAVGIELHETKLGAWDKEMCGESGYFIHAKCYRYYNTDEGHWVYKCAGLPDQAREYITPENFKVGTTYVGKDYGKYDYDFKGVTQQEKMDALKEKSKNLVVIEKGKLLPKIISGGIVLEEIPFTIQ